MEASPYHTYRDIFARDPEKALEGLASELSEGSPFYSEANSMLSELRDWKQKTAGGSVDPEERNAYMINLGNRFAELLEALEKESLRTDESDPTIVENELASLIPTLFDESQSLAEERLMSEGQQLMQQWEKYQAEKASKKGMPARKGQKYLEDLRQRAADLQGNIATFQAGQGTTETPSTPSSSLLEVQTRLESDQWAREDLLGYELYAEVLANIIIRRDTKPPLAMGVIAPWGHGKTTLMHYVRLRLEKEQEAPAKKTSSKASSASPGGLMSKPRHKELEAQLKKVEEGSRDQLFSADTNSWPIVWFNPWQYQSSKQIWAGMAHAMIKQLASRLPAKEREAFYFMLHLRRIDQQAIRQDIYRSVLLRLLPNILIVLLAVVVFFGLITTAPGLSDLTILAVSGTPALLSIINGALGYWKTMHKEANEKYAQYFQQPEYEDKLGMYHDVNEDLQRVFSLLVREDRPAVIFIDDLDRCSPKRVAEVIEAINLLMNGDFREKCYFVLGMDAQVVAAALDVSYKDMYGRLGDRAKTAGSIGWYFLDKFIQLPFFIPTLDEDEKANYLQRLFAPLDITVDLEITPEADQAAMEKRATKQVERAQRGEASKLEGMSKREKRQLDSFFINKALELNKDSVDILDQLQRYAPYLEDSPRGLKRFANMLRYYTAIQQIRIRDGEPYADTEALAKWLTISLRWPQFVRWLQWSQEEYQITTGSKDNQKTETNPVHGYSPIEKARYLDQLLHNLSGNGDSVREVFEKEWAGNHKKELPHIPWLLDIELFEILYTKRDDEASLEQAIALNVW